MKPNCRFASRCCSTSTSTSSPTAASLDAQLDCLVALHGRERIAEWKGLAARGAWREFVARLLVEHYDPAYRRSSHRNYLQLADAAELPISAADDAAFTRAAQALLESIAVATA